MHALPYQQRHACAVCISYILSFAQDTHLTFKVGEACLQIPYSMYVGRYVMEGISN